MPADPTDTRPPLPQRRRTPTLIDEQLDALAEQFSEFQLWRDWRPLDAPGPHLHARKSGWTLAQIINAVDVQELHGKLADYRQEHPDESPELDQ